MFYEDSIYDSVDDTMYRFDDPFAYESIDDDLLDDEYYNEEDLLDDEYYDDEDLLDDLDEDLDDLDDEDDEFLYDDDYFEDFDGAF